MELGVDVEELEIRVTSEEGEREAADAVRSRTRRWA